jgi:hypothetical protein
MVCELPEDDLIFSVIEPDVPFAVGANDIVITPLVGNPEPLVVIVTVPPEDDMIPPCCPHATPIPISPVPPSSKPDQLPVMIMLELVLAIVYGIVRDSAYTALSMTVQVLLTKSKPVEPANPPVVK